MIFSLFEELKNQTIGSSVLTYRETSLIIFEIYNNSEQAGIYQTIIMTTIPPISHSPSQPSSLYGPPSQGSADHMAANDSDLEAEELFNQIQLEGENNPTQAVTSQDNQTRRRNSQMVSQPQGQQVRQQHQPNAKNESKSKKYRIFDLNSQDSGQQQNAKSTDQRNKDAKPSKHHGSNLDKKQRKRLKKQKKLRKKLVKTGKPSEQNKQILKLKKLRKQGRSQHSKDQNNISQQWSGESSSQSEQSDASNDSLLQRLNPTKRKIKNSNKIKNTEEKQGFSLKQLGNEGENRYENQDKSSEDESYSSKKKDKKKEKNKKKEQKQKDDKATKQIKSNQQLLKSLLEIGLCVEQENEGGNNGQEREVDNGLDQVMGMKNTKKKGPKIANKLFADIQIQAAEEHNDPIPKNIELEIKPRVFQGPSNMMSLFLNKTEKLKKVRGMESELLTEDFQKMQSLKAKQSMMKLINQKELEQAEEIVLDVKIPELVKGREEINNSIFLKKVSSAPIREPAAGQTQSQTSILLQIQKYGQYHSNSGKKQKQLEAIKDKQKLKVTRLDFFKSITQEVKTRKSRDITNEAIKNTFKRTNLEQIEQMRKNNEERKRKENLREFSDEDEQNQDGQYELEEVESNEQAMRINNSDVEGQEKPNKLHQLMNFKIEVEDGRKGEHHICADPQLMIGEGQPQMVKSVSLDRNKQQVQQKTDGLYIETGNLLARHQCGGTELTKQQKPNKLSQRQYCKLVRLEQECGMQKEDYQQEQDQEQGESGQNEGEISEEEGRNKVEADLNKMQLEYAGYQQELQNENDKLLELDDDNIPEMEVGKKVDIEVDIQVSNSYEEFLSDSSQGELSQKEAAADGMEEQQYRRYLTELEDEGIKIKKYHNDSHPPKEQLSMVIEEKQNLQQKENSTQLFNHNTNQANEQERKQFHKLRKFATILKQKRKKQYHIRKAGQFYDEEAEEGSDNEQHDGQAKLIDYDEENKEYEGVDLDADLEEFLDNAVDIDQQNQDEAFRKYLEDVKIKDREELKRIMRGDFKRRSEGEPIIEEMEEDEKLRLKRMEEFEEYIKQRQMEDGKDLYIECQNQQKSDDSSEQDGSHCQIENKRVSKKQQEIQYEIEEVDQINEENLARYLDDQYIDGKRTTTVIKKPIVQLPRSYQRCKKTQMRNTLKAKQTVEQTSVNPLKLKKSSSHLNEMIMKNKEKIKPMVFIRNFAVIKR